MVSMGKGRIQTERETHTYTHVMQINTYLEVKFSEAINTNDSRWRTFSCSMISYRSGSVLARGSFKAVAQALVSEVMLLLN